MEQCAIPVVLLRISPQRTPPYSYLQAASWFSEGATRVITLSVSHNAVKSTDDRMFSRALWRALEMQMRIGGISLQGVSYLFTVTLLYLIRETAMSGMIDAAKMAEQDYDLFHGPQDYSEIQG